MVFLRLFACGTLLFLLSCQTSTNKNASATKTTVLSFKAPKSGQFNGFLKLETASTKIPVSFELIPLRNKGDETKYRGHLKLSNGPLGGHEYASYNFEDTTFNISNKTINFTTLNGQTQLNLKYTSIDKTTGTILISTGQKAELTLVHESSSEDVIASIYPTVQESKTITGDYRGQCGSENAVLEIEANKVRGHSPDDAGQLKGYQISARFGQSDVDTCKDRLCFKKFFSEGSFNMFTGQLSLKDGKEEMSCLASGDRITCGSCNLEKQNSTVYASIASKNELQFKPAAIVRDKSIAFDSSRGQFYGYVHNAKQNTYQLIAINIFNESNIKNELGEETLADGVDVQGVVTLYFGQGDSNEYIAYKMKDAVIDQSDQSFFWDSEGEIILKVMSWKNGFMVGDWISRAYGRVGNFMVQRNQIPTMTTEIKTLPKISGIYSSDTWEFEIGAYSELSEDSQEIYPLNSYGWIKEKAPHARRRIIKKINYDFYSGTVAFNLDDGRTIIGKAGVNAMTMFWWPRVNYGSSFVSVAPMEFKKVSESPTPQASAEDFIRSLQNMK
jgi:hypothetical protein